MTKYCHDRDKTKLLSRLVQQTDLVLNRSQVLFYRVKVQSNYENSLEYHSLQHGSFATARNNKGKYWLRTTEETIRKKWVISTEYQLIAVAMAKNINNHGRER